MTQNWNLLMSFILILYSYTNQKYYLQFYLDYCAPEIVNKQITDYLDENLFED